MDTTMKNYLPPGAQSSTQDATHTLDQNIRHMNSGNIPFSGYAMAEALPPSAFQLQTHSQSADLSFSVGKPDGSDTPDVFITPDTSGNFEEHSMPGVVRQNCAQDPDRNSRSMNFSGNMPIRAPILVKTAKAYHFEAAGGPRDMVSVPQFCTHLRSSTPPTVKNTPRPFNLVTRKVGAGGKGEDHCGGRARFLSSPPSAIGADTATAMKPVFSAIPAKRSQSGPIVSYTVDTAATACSLILDPKDDRIIDQLYTTIRLLRPDNNGENLCRSVDEIVSKLPSRLPAKVLDAYNDIVIYGMDHSAKQKALKPKNTIAQMKFFSESSNPKTTCAGIGNASLCALPFSMSFGDLWFGDEVWRLVVRRRGGSTVDWRPREFAEGLASLKEKKQRQQDLDHKDEDDHRDREEREGGSDRDNSLGPSLEQGRHGQDADHTDEEDHSKGEEREEWQRK
ncbi:hypothetical protein TI39_contig4142g00002 [Zymoseptoria brevis]|uniref:Uncharacterized protein n=1 Tax=Zymoseptoria brevis TaxID=1047168 RepID=A0A0F4GCG4_9PEZI|nr:hypothetical protein TI39_contig4142g00002 [Zymoseptoria brevis]